jgi:PKD repeat protein
MSRIFKRDRKAMAGGATEERTARLLPTILSSLLVLLLGVGLVPAFASTAQASTAGRDSDRDSTTKIIGFVSTPTTITVGDTVRDAVSVWPRAERTIEVQARKAGGNTWTKTSASGRSTRAGDFTAVYQPTLGVWQYRLVVKASHHAQEAISATRTITANAPTPPPPDITAPQPVTALTAVAWRTSITLVWVNPAADFTGVTIRRMEGAVAPTLTTGRPVTGGFATARSYTDTGLLAGQQYTYAVFAHDAVPNHAVAATVTKTTTGTFIPDTTPPGPVTGLSVKADSSTDTSVALYWTNPNNDDFIGVMIRRAVGTTPPASPTDGELVRDLVDEVSYVVDVGNLMQGGLNGGTTYSYAFFAYDHAVPRNYAAAANVTHKTTGTPRDLTVPAPVTAATATVASPNSITLAWTNPTDADFTGVMIRRAVGATAPHYNDGSLVTQETPKADTSFTDTGLIAGQQYTYALFAHDAVPNLAAAVTVAATLPASVLPTAVLSSTSVGLVVDFVASGSTAVAPKTLSMGTLDYGDGTAVEAFSAASGWTATHSYAAAGSYQVTLTVVDSAGESSTTVKTVTVSPVTAAPTVAITGPTAPVRVNTPVVFTLATTGDAFGSWTVSDPDYNIDRAEDGTPPETVTHTFTATGTYTVSFTILNNAGQSAESSMVVTVVP